MTSRLQSMEVLRREHPQTYALAQSMRDCPRAIAFEILRSPRTVAYPMYRMSDLTHRIRSADDHEGWCSALRFLDYNLHDFQLYEEEEVFECDDLMEPRMFIIPCMPDDVMRVYGMCPYSQRLHEAEVGNVFRISDNRAHQMYFEEIQMDLVWDEDMKGFEFNRRYNMQHLFDTTPR